MLVKVCGITTAEQAAEISKLVDYVGFIFYSKSTRYTSQSFPSMRARKTGVFVNSPIQEVIRTAQLEKLDAVQLHGNESPEYCAALEKQVTIIKAFGIDSETDFLSFAPYESVVDYFLFDTKTSAHGGSGLSFDWSLLDNYSLQTPFLLSGGLKPELLQEIQQIHHPKLIGIDLNSGFELAPGIKDTVLLKSFIDALRN